MSKTFNSIRNAAIAHNILTGQIGVLPTDTLYGLVCSVKSQAAVDRLYSLKDRHGKPGTLVAATVGQLLGMGFLESDVLSASQFWPGPVSVILPLPEKKYASVTQGAGAIAVRIPSDPDFQKLLQTTGPLLTTSANAPGEKPAENIHEAKDYFGQHLDFYVDGDHQSNAEPSTIIRISDGKVVVLRQGAVKIR